MASNRLGNNCYRTKRSRKAIAHSERRKNQINRFHRLAVIQWAIDVVAIEFKPMPSWIFAEATDGNP